MQAKSKDHLAIGSYFSHNKYVKRNNFILNQKGNFATLPGIVFIIFIVTILGFFILQKHQVTEPISNVPNYLSCEGQSFTGDCSDGKCINQGLEKRVFDIWKRQFLNTYNISVSDFDKSIEISDVELLNGPVRVFVDIRYTLNNDWAKVRQAAAIDLGKFPIDENLSDSEITHFVELALEKDQRFKEKVIGLDELRVSSSKKYKNISINYDFCHIDFGDGGILYLRGYGQKPLGENKCVSSGINLSTGKNTFSTVPCWIE